MTDVASPPSSLLAPEDEVAVVADRRRRPPAFLASTTATVVAQGLTLFGVLVLAYVVYLVAVSGLGHARDQRGLDARFDASVEDRSAPVGGEIAEGVPVARLEIPAIGLDEVVVEGTTGAELKRGPGHLRTSPLPGQRGNVVIAGRRLSYGAPLQDIDRLGAGDVVRVTTGQGTVEYEVVTTRTVSPDDTDVIEDLGDNRLTLVTSTPRLLANRRLVASALLRSSPQPAPAGTPTELRSEELALHADGSNGIALLLWSQALLAAGLATAWLWRRWARRPTALLAAPVLALLVVLVFDSFTPLLPSTL